MTGRLVAVSAGRNDTTAALTVHTLEEAAALLRVKPSWLERQAAARKIPFAMLGGSYRFTSAHLVQIVEIHENLPDTTSQDREPDGRASRTRPHTESLMAMPLRPRPRTGPRRAA